MENQVIDLTQPSPSAVDERETYMIDWHRTLLVAREGHHTLVVTRTGQLLRVAVPLRSLLAAFARRHPLTSNAGWFASQRLYRQTHATTSRLTRSFVNLDLALVAYAGGTSPQAGYYMHHHLLEAIRRPHGLELVFTGDVRVLTTAIPRTQRRLAEEAEAMAHDQHLVLSHIYQEEARDPALQRVAERMAGDYFDSAFEQRCQVRERHLFAHPLNPDWL